MLAFFSDMFSFVLILVLFYFLFWKQHRFPAILVFLSCWVKGSLFYQFDVFVLVCLSCVVVSI